MRWIHVAGCGHTGTTLLAKMLAQSEEVFCNFKENGQFLTYNSLRVSDLVLGFEVEAQKANKSVILEKTPRHVWHLDFIRKTLGPKTKFILTVREPIATITSLFRRTENLASSIQRVQDDFLLTLRAKSENDVRVVRYEDLVSHTRDELVNICKFSKIDFSEKMLSFHLDSRDWFEDKSRDAHINLRNSQLSKPIYQNESTWRDPKALEPNITLWYDKIGKEIAREFRYPIFKSLSDVIN
jgi:hypothetical protein